MESARTTEATAWRTGRYDAPAIEERWQRFWEEEQVYAFDRQGTAPIYAIDTPPPTVSGELHLGHCYSYTQTDLIARYRRMRGDNVFYPMGWDDNGLPTERLVEQRLGIAPRNVSREAFIDAIRAVSARLEEEYERLWRRLGLSVDWRHTYTTVSAEAQRASQYSFIDLYRRGLVYHRSAPTIWCPTCGTAIAQAEVEDLERDTTMVTLAFGLEGGGTLPIATTRPELLPACVAVFVHPSDVRFRHLVGLRAITPLFGQRIPILADDGVDPDKGTGAVMSCTFGDATDVAWWYTHHLPLIAVLDREGRLTAPAGPYAGLTVAQARARIIADLEREGYIHDRRAVRQTVRVHDRCDTPIEHIETRQWFVRLLDHKEELLEAGRRIQWHPATMRSRYETWVQNLNWDWIISRQRTYGVPFPVWHCRACGEVVLADEASLPVDPRTAPPPRACTCSSEALEPESDVLDTWATSSLSPQIAGGWLEDPERFARVFPMALRPQAHDIIRTWAFYTITKSWYHHGVVPWSHVAISGHGLAPEGGKLSKSRGGASLAPHDVMARYSADAVRYWAAGTGLGRDAVVHEPSFAVGQRLVTKLWNVARFARRFLEGFTPVEGIPSPEPTDRWLLSRLGHTVTAATVAFEAYDHVAAKDATEAFFWHVLADNYIEMAKLRLYELDASDPRHESARRALYEAFLAVLQLLAPIMPYITEELYQALFAATQPARSIHRSTWPEAPAAWSDAPAEAAGAALMGIATAVRRYKTDRRARLSTPLRALTVGTADESLRAALSAAALDIRSVTRAEEVRLVATLDGLDIEIPETPGLRIHIAE